MPISADESLRWRLAQARLRATLGDDVYLSWFALLHLEDIKETAVYCTVPTLFLKRWIEDNYQKSLVECISTEWPTTTKVIITERKAGKPLVINDDRRALKQEVLVETEPEKAATESPPDDDDSSQKKNTDDKASDVPADTADQKAEEDTGAANKASAPATAVDPNRRIYVDEIIKLVCTHYRLAQSLIASNKRERKISQPRQIAMFLSKHMTDRSLPDIGRRFGGRDHTTVLHAVRKIEGLVHDNTEFAFEVASLEASIRKRQLA